MRCGAVKAVLALIFHEMSSRDREGGFDSHALPPPASNKTPVSIPGVFYLQVKTNFSKEILYKLKYINFFYPFLAVPLLGKFTHFVYGMFWVIFQWDDVEKHGDFGSIMVFLGAKRAK